MKISEKVWGNLPDERTAHLITINNENGILLSVSDYGGIIQSVITPDRYGTPGDIVLGYDRPEEYAADDCCFGAAIGRVANRISGASFSTGLSHWKLTANEGPNTLHGGTGFHKKLWSYELKDDGLILTCISPDGEDGFPGTLKTDIRFSLSSEGIFRMEYSAVSDADTLCSITGHSYFNLSGKAASAGRFRTTADHMLQICAESFTPFDQANLPTGEIKTVEDSVYDFRTLRSVGTKALDINYVMNHSEEWDALLSDPESGRSVFVASSLPGLQLYNGTGISPRQGKGGSEYSPQSGLCLEPQFFPDAIHHPNFSSPLLKAGELYQHFIEYRFVSE